jgi:zinc transport system substrate-binding protein
MTVVDATQGIQKRAMAEGCCEHGEHEHEHEYEHGHKPGHEHESEHADHRDGQVENLPHKEGLDPHVWLSPPLLKVIAKNVAAALCQADPDHAADFRANLAGLDQELDDLHSQIARDLAPFRGHTFYVFHPAFGYFGDTYGLKQQAVEVEGKSPSPRQLRRLIQQAQADNVKILFLQPQFDHRSAEAVAAGIGGFVQPMDDLAWDVIGNLGDVARKIAAALRNCKLQIDKRPGGGYRGGPTAAGHARRANLPRAICNLQFAICNLQFAMGSARHA